jgi:hypothetical protein
MDKTQLWGDAVIEHPLGVDAFLYANIGNELFLSVSTLTFIVFLLLIYKYLHRSILPIINCCFRFSQTIKTQDNLSLEQGRLVLFIFSLFHISIGTFYLVYLYRTDLFVLYGWLLIPFFLLFLILFYCVRWMVFIFIGWVIRRQNELKFIAKGSRDFFILAALLTLPLSLSALFTMSSMVNILIIWCISAFILSYLLFLYRTLHYFIYVRFSVFFWFLYLCSFEIAPLVLLYSVFLTI